MENQISKPPYINRPPIKPPKNSMPELKEEFMRISEGMADMDAPDKLLASLACDEVLLDVIKHPDWTPDEPAKTGA